MSNNEKTMELRNQWFQLVDELSLDSKELSIVFKWLKVHPDYDEQAFWMTPFESGDLPMSHLLKSLKHKDWVVRNFFPIVKDFVPQKILEAQFNQPNTDGFVFFHLLWNRMYKGVKSLQHDFNATRDSGLRDVALAISKILAYTDPVKFCFLDEPGASPASGLRHALMEVLSSKTPSEVELVAKNMMDQLAILYPPQVQPVAPQESPWRGALSVSKVLALDTLGHRLDEMVKVGDFEVPAWKWLLLQHVQAFEKTDYRKNLNDLIEKQGLSDVVNAWLETDVKRFFSSLVPADRRAKVGYVDAVLRFTGPGGTPCFDAYGRNPMDYLVKYRSDLLDIFCIKAMKLPTQEFRARFMQPDAAGIPAVFRFVSTLSEEKQPLLRQLLEHHGCWEDPSNYLRQRGGLFKLCLDISGWRKASEGSEGRLIEMKKIKKSMSDPSVLFGDQKQQAVWNAWWIENFSKWSEMRSWLTKNNNYSLESSPWVSLPEGELFPRQAIQQLLCFLSNGDTPEWKERMSPELWTTLHVATCAITTGLEKKSSDQWFSKLRELSHELANNPDPVTINRFDVVPSSRWGVTLTRNPCEVPLSEALLTCLVSAEGGKVRSSLNNKADLPGRHYSMQNKEEIIDWDTWVKREYLNKVGVQERPRAKSDIRM